MDNKTNKIVKTAPIFDNGLSLFYGGMNDDLSDIDDYASNQTMKNAGDFMTFATSIMTSSIKKKIQKLSSFKFERDKKYNLPAKRLKIIEGFIQRRVKKLLEL